LFNPISWWLKKAIKVNIEFIADYEVIRQGIAHQAYQNSLLHFAVQSQNLPLVNQFSFLSLKSRIMMMNKKQSSKGQLGKYFLVIPVVISSLFIFGVSKAYKTSESTEIIFQELLDQPESPTSQDTSLTREANLQILGFKTGIEDSTASTIKNSLVIIDGKSTNQSFEEVRTKVPVKDIKSITVLKGQQATSVFGDKANDGAILIVTKLEGESEDKEGKSEIIFKRRTTSLEGDSIAKVVGTVRSIVRKEGTGKITLERKSDAALSDSLIAGSGTIIVKRNSDLSATTISKGKPSEGAQIFFNSSISKSSPLYILDGKELDPSSLKNIDPKQIKSINVLKGESAKTIYGEKGTNGIIEIELK
jgi:TonB-dependent SusC/RagA subfamily outer membrane receptor